MATYINQLLVSKDVWWDFKIACLLDFSPPPPPPSPLSVEVSPTNEEQIHRLIMNRYKRSSAEGRTKPSETTPFTPIELRRAGLSWEWMTGVLNCRKWKAGRDSSLYSSVNSFKVGMIYPTHPPPPPPHKKKLNVLMLSRKYLPLLLCWNKRGYLKITTRPRY